jgi:RNA polymerase sigma-70 factor (ECF subfamily)
MESWRHGNTSDFRQVVALHQGYAFGLAFRILCESEEAKDVVQECFIRIWTHRAEYRPEVKLTTWIYTIVSNLCNDRLRARMRRARVITTRGADAEDFAVSSEQGPEELAENRDLAERITALAASLPEKQRTIFTLRDLQDQSIEEIADILGMSSQSVRTNLCYARAAIRSRLQHLRKEENHAMR